MRRPNKRHFQGKWAQLQILRPENLLSSLHVVNLWKIQETLVIHALQNDTRVRSAAGQVVPIFLHDQAT